MRILLADDHSLFRDGVASLLEAWGHQVVGQASDGAQAIDLAARLHPDLVLMDVRMPSVSGLEATAHIKAADPRVSIVMLTVSEDEDDLFAAIQMGAQGYLLKNLESRELRGMIEAVGRGEPAISPQTAARILQEFARGQRSTSLEPERLTERELSVLAPGRGGSAQQGDRGGAGHQREHREVPPQEHGREAPRARPRRACRPRRARRCC